MGFELERGEGRLLDAVGLTLGESVPEFALFGRLGSGGGGCEEPGDLPTPALT